MIRPGGWIAVWWTLFGDPSRPDPFAEATRALLGEPVSTTATPDRPPFELDVAGWTHALSTRAGLIDVKAELIPWAARLDPDQIRSLYGSMIAVRRRPPTEQQALLDELAQMARLDYGGLVERPFVTAVYTAKRPDTS